MFPSYVGDTSLVVATADQCLQEHDGKFFEGRGTKRSPSPLLTMIWMHLVVACMYVFFGSAIQ